MKVLAFHHWTYIPPDSAKSLKSNERTIQSEQHSKELSFHPFLDTISILRASPTEAQTEGYLSAEQNASPAESPSQTASEAGEGLNTSPLLVSIITFYLTSTRLWLSCSFWPGLYNLNFSIVQPVQAKKGGGGGKQKETKKPTVPSLVFINIYYRRNKTYPYYR